VRVVARLCRAFGVPLCDPTSLNNENKSIRGPLCYRHLAIFFLLKPRASPSVNSCAIYATPAVHPPLKAHTSWMTRKAPSSADDSLAWFEVCAHRACGKVATPIPDWHVRETLLLVVPLVHVFAIADPRILSWWTETDLRTDSPLIRCAPGTDLMPLIAYMSPYSLETNMSSSFFLHFWRGNSRKSHNLAWAACSVPRKADPAAPNSEFCCMQGPGTQCGLFIGFDAFLLSFSTNRVLLFRVSLGLRPPGQSSGIRNTMDGYSYPFGHPAQIRYE